MKLTSEDKIAACTAMLRSDSFVRGNALMFLIGANVYCVVQMIGPPATCKKHETTNWSEALKMFEEYAREAS